MQSTLQKQSDLADRVRRLRRILIDFFPEKVAQPQFTSDTYVVRGRGEEETRMSNQTTTLTPEALPMAAFSTLRDGSLFGPSSRYKLHRHESVRPGISGCWMVLDAESVDPVTGGPAVIRQADTIEEAVAGLFG